MKVIRKEGEIVPSFYYGLAYRNWMDYSTVYYIMPFNYIIRWKRYIHHWWIRNIQHRESWFDKEVKKVINDNAEIYRGMYVRSDEQVTRYHYAYLECLTAMLKSNVPKETIDRLHRL